MHYATDRHVDQSRSDRVKGTKYLQDMYRDHYTINNDVKPFVNIDRTKWTLGPNGWWRTVSGRSIL